MTKDRLRITRMQFGFALGILVVIAARLHSTAGVMIAYTLFALVTALRLHSLGRPVWRTFIPLGLVVAGTAVAAALFGPASARGQWVLVQTHAFALLGQTWISIRAALAWAECDPRSPKTALTLDVLAKRRTLIDLGRAVKPIRAARERDSAAMMALHRELREHGQAHGFMPSPEIDAIRARMAAQQGVLDRSRAAEAAFNESLMAATEELKSASKALREYRRAA